MGSHLSDVWFQVTDLVVVRVRLQGHHRGRHRVPRLHRGHRGRRTGHCHPQVVAAIQEQAAKFIHAQVNCYRHDLLEQLGDRLAEITPDGIDTFFFANSGAEATEAAVKLAKQATGRPNVIVFSGSFHGRSHLTMAMTTSKTGYRAGYAPLPAGVFVAPFPDRSPATRARRSTERTRRAATTCCCRRPRRGRPRRWCSSRCSARAGTSPPRPLPAGARGDLPRARDPVRRRRGADRVRAHRHDVRHRRTRASCPTCVFMAKGLASGFPISAIGARRPSSWRGGRRASHGGTYGGNPIGCAAALATIDVLTEPGFLDNVNARGDQLRAGFAKLVASDPGTCRCAGRR